MKKCFTLIGAILMAGVMHAQVLTVNLDMSDAISDGTFDVTANELFVSGIIDWWTPGSDPTYQLVDDDSDGIYTMVLDALTPDYYAFDYYIIDAGTEMWGTEWPSPTGSDRWVYLEDGVDKTINDKWGETHTITLNVDMNNADLDPATEEVYVTGSAMGWWVAPGADVAYQLLDADQDGIYSIEFTYANSEYSYLFYKVPAGTSTWDNPEWSVAVERVLSIEGDDVTMNDTWGVPASPILTINLDMSDAITDGTFDAAANELFISGIVDWYTPGSNPTYQLLDDDSDGIYTLLLDNLSPDYYAFDYYIIDAGTEMWGAEWPSPTGSDRWVYLEEGDNKTINDKWEETHTITLNVDMNSAAFDPTTEELFVTGSAMGWWVAPGADVAYQLLDADQDGIYSIEFTYANSEYSYLYYKVPTGTSSWDFPEWAEATERLLDIDGENVTMNDTWGTTVSSPMIESLLRNISLYPNPTNGILHIDVDKKCFLNVFDITGKSVFKQHIESYNSIIDLTDQNAGLYFIQFILENQVKTYRIIIR